MLTASASSEVTIVAANAAELNVDLIATFASRLPDGGHTDFSESFGSPHASTTMLALVVLRGPVDDNIRFSLIGDNSAELGALDLKAISDPAVQPTTFAGEFAVPSSGSGFAQLVAHVGGNNLTWKALRSHRADSTFGSIPVR